MYLRFIKFREGVDCMHCSPYIVAWSSDSIHFKSKFVRMLAINEFALFLLLSC
jgi:hypothetical protein